MQSQKEIDGGMAGEGESALAVASTGLSARRRRRFGFTLIEMMAVIAIISIIAGILLAAVQKARTHSRKARARSEVQQVVVAWMAYLEEYRKFPSVPILTMGSNAVAILQGGACRDNPKGGVFMEFNVGATNYVDPWGREYHVRLDTDGDNYISGLPGVSSPFNVAVAVWSEGERTGTNDYIRSWKQ